MKRTPHFISLALMFFVGLSAWADQRSYTQAQKIAEAKAKSLGIVIDNTAKAKAKALHVAAAEKQSDAAYYVFPFGTGKGFAIVSGDDRMPEIVGYTDSGTFDEAQMSDGMKAYLQSYQAMAEAVKAGNKQALRTLEEYRLYKASGKQATDAISPLLGNITWNQRSPYNKFCPAYIGTIPSATGCVATSMAQVLAYWKWPSCLQADIPAYTTHTKHFSMPAISAGEVYDWDNMLPDYSNGYTEEQANAVAKLMLHCGTAIGMDYRYSSAAYVYASDFAKFFGYDADLLVDVRRSAVSLAQWTKLIDNELKAKRPIIYCGFSSDIGHNYVCDGRDKDGLYHINWGWGGSENGYFDITVLNPHKGGTGSGNATDGYNRLNRIIIGIQPDNGIKDAPLIEPQPEVVVQNDGSDDFHSGMKITQGTRELESDSFEVNIKNAFNCNNSHKYNTKIGYGISDGKNGYTLLYETKVQTITDDEDMHCESTFKFAPKAGTDTIYVLYCKEGESTWHKCMYDGVAPYIFTATTTALTLTPENYGLTAVFEPKSELHTCEVSPFEMTISNNSDNEYNGNINVYYNTVNECPETAARSSYIFLAAHSSITSDITLSTTNLLPNDKFYVWVKDVADRELISAAEFTMGEVIHPVLILVSVETNATPNEYEKTENTCLSEYKIKAPKINDDCMKVRYGYVNVGAEGKIRYTISAANKDNQGYYKKKGYETVYMPADSSVTYLEETWSPDEMNGERFIICKINILLEDSDTQPTIVSGMEKDTYKLYLADPEYEGLGFYLPVTTTVGYVAGKPAGIDNIKIADGVTIAASKGEIVVRTDKAESLTVYSVDGRLVTQITVEAGSEKSISLPTGVYVVNGQKVVVR